MSRPLRGGLGEEINTLRATCVFRLTASRAHAGRGCASCGIRRRCIPAAATRTPLLALRLNEERKVGLKNLGGFELFQQRGGYQPRGAHNVPVDLDASGGRETVFGAHAGLNQLSPGATAGHFVHRSAQTTNGRRIDCARLRNEFQPASIDMVFDERYKQFELGIGEPSRIVVQPYQEPAFPPLGR